MSEYRLQLEEENARLRADNAALRQEVERLNSECGTLCSARQTTLAALACLRQEVERLLKHLEAVNGLRLEEVARLRQENERLLAQLPDGMKKCTILFKECEKGHGWLTATNWVQHGCPTCERDSLRTAIAAKDAALAPFADLCDGRESMPDHTWFGLVPYVDDEMDRCDLTLADFRKARAARQLGA